MTATVLQFPRSRIRRDVPLFLRRQSSLPPIESPLSIAMRGDLLVDTVAVVLTCFGIMALFAVITILLVTL